MPSSPSGSQSALILIGFLHIFLQPWEWVKADELNRRWIPHFSAISTFGLQVANFRLFFATFSTPRSTRYSTHIFCKKWLFLTKVSARATKSHFNRTKGQMGKQNGRRLRSIGRARRDVVLGGCECEGTMEEIENFDKGTSSTGNPIVNVGQVNSWPNGTEKRENSPIRHPGFYKFFNSIKAKSISFDNPLTSESNDTKISIIGWFLMKLWP